MPNSNTRTVVAIDYAQTPSRHPHYNSHQTSDSRPSQILTHHTPSARLDLAQPEFAELLTPLKLRRRKLQPRPDQQPTSLPLVAGPSRLGYYTLEGDLYRGSAYDPTQPPSANVTAQVDDDAISLGTGSTTSSTSNWSWGSGNFDRAMAVIERVGEALGVRRGSAGSSSSDSSADSSDMESLKSQATAPRKDRKRRGSFMSSLSRQTSRGAEGVKAKHKREQLPKRRQFTLLVPPPELPSGDVDIGIPSTIDPHVFAEIGKLPGGRKGDKKYPPDRVIITPSLPTVLDKIQSIRLSSGYSGIPNPVGNTPPQTPGAFPSTPTPNLTSRVPVRRGGSAPGRSRKATGFVNPPVPLLPQTQSRLQCQSQSTAASRTATQSRLHTLRGAAESIPPVRPKSASDLLGLKFDAESMKEEAPMMERKVGLEQKGKSKSKGCWWLDVSCPTWEDLREIGELLGLHPLTLEDVLQQDPREKLERFDKLGYYFLVIRALDENYFKYTPGSSISSPSVPGGKNNGKGGNAQTPKSSPSEKELIDEKEGLSQGINDKSGNNKNEDGNEQRQDIEGLEYKKSERRRRGWGMGRAQGKMTGKMGEKVEIIEDRPGKEGLEGVGVGAVNVYLVVFADGIISFHFEDISKHTNRVLDRVLTLANPDHGADWIAHGLLDSIVDAFFPIIRYVDGAVDDIDSLTIDPTTDPKKTSAYLGLGLGSVMAGTDEDGNERFKHGELGSGKKRNGLWRTPDHSLTQHISLRKRLRATFPHFCPPPRLLRTIIYLRLFLLPTSSAVKRKHDQASKTLFDRSTMLKNMTDMRKLVTGLTRLLSAKGTVIGRLRKRAKEEGGTVEAYIGDVEDHILLLQNSLYHYEYILSHCQPAYLSHLNVSFAVTKGRTDQAILALSVVAISILPMQFITGLFSMNVYVPHNGWIHCPTDTLCEPDGSMSPFNYFAAIVIGIALVACCMVSVIRWWRWDARKKFGRLRGVELPNAWDGFWGWE
ncbi:cation transporter [Cryptococcus neoformans c45]|nr:cation transporter [Cryptococcus neoformans var. grubii c45]